MLPSPVCTLDLLRGLNGQVFMHVSSWIRTSVIDSIYDTTVSMSVFSLGPE